MIDRDGNIRDIIEGILPPEEFEQKIKPLLKADAGEIGPAVKCLPDEAPAAGS